MNNRQISQLLKEIAAVYAVLPENRFREIAYRQAAETIEQLDIELGDLRRNKTDLASLPAIGKSIAEHLEELVTKGRSSYFSEIKTKVPAAMFVFLKLNGVGPKTAYRLAKIIGPVLKKKGQKEDQVLVSLEQFIKAGQLQSETGFAAKKTQELLRAINDYRRQPQTETRLPLAVADGLASQILAYLKASGLSQDGCSLGSLRRRQETIGDIDIAVATRQPEAVIAYFIKYPQAVKTIEKGVKSAAIRLQSGVQIDLRVSRPEEFGAMQQYFTGSKSHNIKLRELALKKGLSLSEYGIKSGRKRYKYAEEEAFYKKIGLIWIPPELRENRGEIAAAHKNNLPKLVQINDIRGDLHLHSSFDVKTSHDLGENSIEELILKAAERGYEYLGIADHNPRQSQITESEVVKTLQKRQQEIEQSFYRTKSEQNITRVRKVFNLLEVDIRPDGNLALPEAAFAYLDAVLVSIHSQFRLSAPLMTRRILKALSFPKVRVLAHPTARLLGRREPIACDWPEIFAFCQAKEIALEINASQLRLDLPDSLVFEAVKAGAKLIIDTDSHNVADMAMMPYGVAVARRGWAEKSDIMNTKSVEEFSQWLMKI